MLTKEMMPGTVTEGRGFHKEGKIRKNGQEINYFTEAQEYIFINADDEMEASFFAISHFKKNDDKKKNERPVMFVYEGGPGAASTELYLGLFGPYTFTNSEDIEVSPTPPYSFEENENCLLDICDIVMVDPVGTGFAKLYKEECASKYLGVEADAAASRKFISFWLDKYDRWNSPKFICGKSYGGMRAAVYPYYFLGGAMDPQLGQFGIGLNGTIILCDPNVGDFQNMVNPRMSAPNQPAELNLIATFAAINHFHNPEGKPELRKFIDEAHDFAYGDYAHALLIGEVITESELNRIAEKLEFYTGVDKNIFIGKQLHIDIRTFSATLLAKSGKEVSLYDGRLTKETVKCSAQMYDSSSDDPLLISLWTKQVAVMHDYMKDIVGIDWNREYLVQNYQVGWNWDFSLSKSASVNELLNVAAARNPGMKIFMGKGIYDCITTIGDGRYTLNHYNLPKERITYKEYESGHAIWLGKNAKKKICDDLRTFIMKSI